MSHQYETGNAKNVANLQKLIEQVTTYTNYNPSVENLKIENLNTLYTNALAILSTLEEKRLANKNAIHQRQQTYEPLKPTCTRIINQLEILGLPSGTLNQAKFLNRLIQGTTKKKEQIQNTENNNNKENNNTTNHISTSRQSYTQLADNFSKLLQLLSTIPSYNPNTEDLKLTNLNTYHAALVETTKTVDQTEAELNTKFIERNTILYADGTGLYYIAQNVKKYIKILYGATSPEYAKVAKIKFTNPI